MLSILKSIKVGWTLLFEKGSRFKMILAGTLMAFALVFPFVMGVYLPVAMRDLTAYIYGAFERDLLELIMAYILALVFGVLVTLPAFGWFITY